MLYYRMEADCAELPTKEYRDADGELWMTSDMSMPKFEAFYQARGRACYLFVYRYGQGKLRMGGILRSGAMDDALLQDFLGHLGGSYSGPAFCEITVKEITSLLRQAERNDFIESDDDVINCFLHEGLGVLTQQSMRMNMTEQLIAPAEKDALLRRARELYCADTLGAEMERIFQGRACDAPGHPVHYIVRADSRAVFDGITEALLGALLQNDRLHSRRFTLLRTDGRARPEEAAFPKLFRSCAGGAVGLRCAGKDEDEDDYAGSQLQALTALCEAAGENRHEVLTILWLPRAAEKQQRLLLELLPEMTFITLTEDLLDGGQARAFLTRRAQDNHLEPDTTLFADIESHPEQMRWPEELRRMYGAWHGRQLKSVVYSQYADFDSARKRLGEAKPQGSAWDELQSMVGLTQAKAVMQQALDYFKAQKLFRAKGMQSRRPAMHMAFTGSPGTAKTTAARLFARIMKENGLLAVGDLIEVGRGDLVGKYVGWTAQIVQQKFRQAKGSVLFIDEAYALVDDKAGLYGDEAINTIVQEMENHREDVAVIFAGYSDKMEAFLRRNPGLRSRVAFHVPFDDYSAHELLEILELMLGRDGMRLDAGLQESLAAHFAQAKMDPDFGNGRYVRNLLEQAKMKQASRLLALDPDTVTRVDLELLMPEDFTCPAPEKRTQKIGFALA